MQGTFWVLVFFIISGFVLPMRFFETGTGPNLCIKMIKRYFRLMIPLFAIITIYWVYIKTENVYSDYESVAQFIHVPAKSFGDLWYDGLVATWLNNHDYNGATWTLSIELQMSLAVYIAASIIRRFNAIKGWLYLACTVVFIVIKMLQWFTTLFGTTRVRLYFPLFIMGAAICENEIKKGSLSDKLKSLAYYKRSVIYSCLLVLTLVYGSYQGTR